jgi:hypothetical protein
MASLTVGTSVTGMRLGFFERVHAPTLGTNWGTVRSC